MKIHLEVTKNTHLEVRLRHIYLFFCYKNQIVFKDLASGELLRSRCLSATEQVSESRKTFSQKSQEPKSFESHEA